MNRELNIIIQNLKSNEAVSIIGALQIILDMKNSKKKGIAPEFVDYMYPFLIPFLIHNNYKIRSLAFQVETYFLTDYQEYIYNAIDAFPNVITSLASINKSVVRYACECAKSIMNIEDPIKWWPEVESKLLRSRSNPQKEKILDILLEHADEMHFCDAVNQNLVPLQSICKLLDNPNLKIQKKTMEILSKVEQAELKYSLKAAERLQPAESSDSMIDFSKKHIAPRKARDRAASPRNLEFSTSDDEENSYSRSNFARRGMKNKKNHVLRKHVHKHVNENNEATSSSYYYYEYDYSENDDNIDPGSPESKKRKRKRRVYNTDSQSSIPKSPLNNIISMSSKGRLSHKSNNNKNYSDDSQRSEISIKSDETDYSYAYYSDPSNPDVHIKHKHYHHHEKTGDKSNNNDAENKSNESSKDISAKGKNGKTSKTFRQGNPIRETVGDRPAQSTNDSAFELRDLSILQIVQKFTYLHELEQFINKPGKLRIPPDQIIDCVLTAAFPICKQIVPLISNIFSNLLSQNPELISVFAEEILRFILFGIRILNDPNAFKPLTDTLFLEGDPNDLIITAVTIADAEKRSLHLETYFLPLFQGEEPVILQKQSFYSFLCHLVHNAYPDAERIADRKPESLRDVSTILSTFAVQQRALYIEFMNLQTMEAKKILEKFLVTDNESFTRPYDHNAGILNLDNPMETFSKEIKKGEESNLILIADALDQMDLIAPRRLEIVFKDIIRFFSVLSQEKVQRNKNEIKRICGSHFDHPQLMQIIETDEIVPDLIFGLSIFVWYCPKSALASCNCFYYPLYNIFKKASGDIREQVILIEMAIRRATGRNIIDSDFVHDAHKRLIAKLEKQFTNH